MYALEITKPGKFNIIDIPQNSSPIELSIKMLASTICGSDLKISTGEMEGIKYPLIPGHEWVGEVVSTPIGYEHLKGKRVVPDILYCCNSCLFCKKDVPNLCDQLLEPGLTLPGGFSQFISLKPENAYEVPENLTDLEASLLEPLAVALYAAERINVTEDDIVLIIGGGGIGQLIGQCVRLSKPKKIILADHHKFRLKMANALFADLTVDGNEDLLNFFSNNADLRPTKIFEVTGSEKGIKLAVSAAQKNADIGIVGYSGSKIIGLKTSEIMVKHLTIKGVLSPTNTLQDAIKLTKQKKIHLKSLVTHVFDLKEAAQAFKFAGNRKSEALRVSMVC